MKRLLILITSIILCVNAFTLIACNQSVEHEHNFIVQKITDDYKKKSADCTSKAEYYYSCECGAKSEDIFEYGTFYHTYSKKVVSNDYLKKLADCSSKAEYFYSCECGAKGEDTFEYGLKASHFFNADGCERCDDRFNPNSEFLGTAPLDSNIVSEYTFRQNSVMPIVSITTNSGEDILTKEYVDAKISISNCEEKYLLDQVASQVKVRGNATATYDKKPFRIKFDKKQYMLGLNDDLKAKSWVLLAEAGDLTMMKQSLALYLGKGLLECDGLYCSDFMHVEVKVNGEYRGVYLLVEQQQINESRVNIFEAEDDYQGVDIGYFFELDGYYSREEPLQRFTVDYEYPLTLANGENTLNFMQGYTIKSDIYSQAQNDYLAKVTKNIYAVVYDTLYNDHENLTVSPYLTLNDDGDIIKDQTILTSKEAVAKVVNVSSFVDTYILNQIAMDGDMSWSSFFLSLDMSENGVKKLTLQAPWDFEHGFGHRPEPNVDAVNQPYKDIYGNWSMELSNPWLMLLSNESWFKQLVYEKWTEVKEKGLFVSAVDMMDTYATIYDEQYNANFDLWYNSQEFSFENLIDIKNWMQTRLSFLNRFFSTFANN